MPDESYFDAADLLGEVFVETDQTVCRKNLALWKLAVFRITCGRFSLVSQNAEAVFCALC